MVTYSDSLGEDNTKEDNLSSHWIKYLKKINSQGLITAQQLESFLERINQDKKKLPPLKAEESPKRPSIKILMHFYQKIQLLKAEESLPRLEKEIKNLIKQWNEKKIGKEEAKNLLEKAYSKKSKLEKQISILKDKKTLEVIETLNKFTNFMEQLKSLNTKQATVKLDEERVKEMSNLAFSLQEQLREDLKELQRYLSFFEKQVDDLSAFGTIFGGKQIVDKFIYELRTLIQEITKSTTQKVEYSFKMTSADEQTILQAVLPITMKVLQNYPSSLDIQFSEPPTIMKKKREEWGESPEYKGKQVTRLKKEEESFEIKPDNQKTEGQAEKKVVVESSKATSPEEKSFDPWDGLGRPIVTPSNELLGLGGYPVRTPDGTLYLECIEEESVTKKQIEALFNEVQVIHQIEGTSYRSKGEKLFEEISSTLELPLQLASYPTIINEYCAKRNIQLPSKIYSKIKQKRFFPVKMLSKVTDSTYLQVEKKKSLIISENLQPLPSTGHSCLGIELQEAKVVGVDGRQIGIVKQLIDHPSRGKAIVIERDTPSNDLLKILREKSRFLTTDDSLWSFRYTISNRIGVFEGEAFLPWNLWKFVWTEKILLTPWEIRADYFSCIPVDTIREVEGKTIALKRRTVIEPLISWYPVTGNYFEDTNQIIGIFTGKALSSEPLQLLICELTPKAILKAMKKPTAETAIKRMQKRVSTALGITEKQQLDPSSLIKYFYHFSITLDNLSDYETAMNWGIEQFQLTARPIELIHSSIATIK